MPRIREWPLYPGLIAASWVLASMVDTGAHILTTVRVWAVVLIVVVGILALAWRLSRSPHRAGLITLGILFPLGSADFGRLGLAVVGIAAAILALVLSQRIRHRPAVNAGLTAGVNLLATALLGVTMLRGLMNGSVQAALSDLVASAPPIADFGSGPAPPDIYLILLDGYPREDVMRETLGADNQQFVDALERRGFDVAAKSHAGYMYTDLTVATLLNGRHLVDIEALDPMLDGIDRPALMRQVINSAPLLESLAAAGYTLCSNAQAWDGPALRRMHRFVDGTGWNEFERHMLLATLPGHLGDSYVPGFRQALIEPWVTDGLQFISDSTRLPVNGPRFVLAHVPSPHFPIIFQADGSRAEPRFGVAHPGYVNASPEDVVHAYLGQVAYLNRRVIDAIDRMQVPGDAIVIILSDHGPEFGLNWWDWRASALSVRFATLFASRARDISFPDDVGAETTLARILNGMFDAGLPVPGRRFFGSNAGRKIQTLDETSDPWGSASD